MGIIVKKDSQYGILMNSFEIGPNIFAFKPLYVVEGMVIPLEEGLIFEDTVGNTYSMSDDAVALFTGEDITVTEIISKRELINKYGDISINDALGYYYEEITNHAHIGIYDGTDGKFKVLSLTLNQELDDKESLNEKKEITDEKPDHDLDRNMIYFKADQFKNLLLNDDDKLRLELEGIYKEFEKFKESVKNNDSMEDIEDIPNQNEVPKKINMKEMKEFFDEKIIGQEEAKKDIIRSVFMNNLSNDKHDRTICLLIGPTGSGKTLIAETLKEYLDVPMEIYDTTQLTVPGYKGGDIEDICTRLLAQTNGDLNKAEHAIVVFDEIDKKGSAENDDISGRGVLNTLLSFIQGTTYNIEYNKAQIAFDTSKLTIFATGAFTNVAEVKNDENKPIGFYITKEENKEDIKYDKITIQDLAKQGNMPIELLGRFSVITQLHGHTRESLKQIILSSNGALLREKAKLAKIGIELNWTEGFIDAVVNKAFELKTGARSLKYTIEQAVKEANWEVCTNLDVYKGIILTEDSVLDNNMCILINKNDEKILLNDIINNDKVKVKVLGG